jgi:hypothetical protein
LEPLHPRQIRALRKASGIETFYVFLNMNDFLIDLATKGGRRTEFKKLAEIIDGPIRDSNPRQKPPKHK